jgi:hypothetical protein
MLVIAATSLRGAKRTKQSILSLRGAMDCFASLAMTILPSLGIIKFIGRSTHKTSPKTPVAKHNLVTCNCHQFEPKIYGAIAIWR